MPDFLVMSYTPHMHTEAWRPDIKVTLPVPPKYELCVVQAHLALCVPPAPCVRGHMHICDKALLHPIVTAEHQHRMAWFHHIFMLVLLMFVCSVFIGKLCRV